MICALVGEELVGWQAIRPGCASPAQTFHSVKRLIGRHFTDVSALAKLLPFQVQPVGDDDEGILIGCQSAPFMAPEEVGSAAAAS